MKFVKVLLWSMIVAFPFVSFSSCATSGLMGVASRTPGDVSRQLTTQEPIQQPARENSSIQQVQFVSHGHNLAVQQNQLAQADYIQPAHRVTVAPAPAVALITLGPNDNLNEIIGNAPGVVLLDYYADWCGPCRKQGGILHDMESQAAKTGAIIVKINVDQHQELASKFRVSSLPTLMLIKDGRILERQSGIADHQKVASLLNR